jgi:5-methylcytosine-specific restriction protein A
VKELLSYINNNQNNNLIKLGFAEYQNNLHSKIQQSFADTSKVRQKRLQKTSKKPKITEIIHTVFMRNADVIAEVLVRAKGICEFCHQKAPFIRTSDNTPYLEVHHKTPLAQGGDDTVKNAVALCPNCHRKAHFGKK